MRPQGGRVANIDDEAVFAAIIYVLVSGCAWRALPACFGASKSTVHRRFLIWSRAGVWGRLHQKARTARRPGPGRPLPGGARLRLRPRQKRGELAGPSPVDRVSRVPRCTSCPTRTNCPYASDSLQRTLTTASG
ncbi:transposase [Streptomyces sp. R11]|uniref:Transposase n=1 Tax=Streptomyces sp. R11 TaxID=3238625 RepID=A0AB39NHI5_9ACTN